jgi:hypothetical protein
MREGKTVGDLEGDGTGDFFFQSEKSPRPLSPVVSSESTNVAIKYLEDKTLDIETRQLFVKIGVSEWAPKTSVCKKQFFMKEGNKLMCRVRSCQAQIATSFFLFFYTNGKIGKIGKIGKNRY